jgi:hypothetical protein
MANIWFAADFRSSTGREVSTAIVGAMVGAGEGCLRFGVRRGRACERRRPGRTMTCRSRPGLETTEAIQQIQIRTHCKLIEFLSVSRVFVSFWNSALGFRNQSVDQIR